MCRRGSRKSAICGSRCCSRAAGSTCRNTSDANGCTIVRMPRRVARPEFIGSAVAAIAEPDGEHPFDVVLEPGEKNDLRATRADMFDQIKARYRAWNAETLPLPATS